jgi:uncharacterized SAM-binding protein YcdF (DUF218 family)
VRRSKTATSIVTALLIGVGLVVSGVVYLVVNLASIIVVGSRDSGKTADVIVVMGAAQYDGRPSPQLAARLDHAKVLWEQERAPLIAVTGGKMEGDRFTEAEASRMYLVAAGIPDEVIIGEDQGTATWDSIVSLSPILESRNIRSVVVVTDPYHEQRSVLSFRQNGFATTASATNTSPLSGRTLWERTMKEAVGISVGRLVGFDTLFDLTG